jgi:hypothetical protein
MKIITSNPVFESGETKSPSEMYYEFGNPLAGIDVNKLTSQASEYQASQEKKGFNWDAIKNAWVKVKESGAIDAAKNLAGKKPKGKPSGRPSGRPPQGKVPTQEKKGMSTTTKVLIGVGVVAIVAFAIYKSRSK